MSTTHELITSPVPSMIRVGEGIELDTARIDIFRKIVRQP